MIYYNIFCCGLPFLTVSSSLYEFMKSKMRPATEGLMYRRPAGCTPWRRLQTHCRQCRCMRRRRFCQRWRSAAGGLQTEPSLAGLPSARSLKDVNYRAAVIRILQDVCTQCFPSESLAVLPPGEARGRYPAGLAHQSDGAPLSHGQGRDLVGAADTGRNCDSDKA